MSWLSQGIRQRPPALVTPYNDARRRGDIPPTGTAVDRSKNPPLTLNDLLGNTPFPPPVDFAALDKDAIGAAGRQRKRAARNSLLLEGQPADAAATSPIATLQRRRLGGSALAY